MDTSSPDSRGESFGQCIPVRAMRATFERLSGHPTGDDDNGHDQGNDLRVNLVVDSFSNKAAFNFAGNAEAGITSRERSKLGRLNECLDQGLGLPAWACE